MRNSLVVLFLCFTLSLSGATYYVATNGSDSNPGTISQPWLTMQKGFNSISPGDILYIRGGTYTPSGTSYGGFSSGVIVSGKHGSASNMYNVFAYPGEVPVLDCRNISSSSETRVGIFLSNSDYWYIKGIIITRVDQYQGPPAHMAQGLMILNGNYNKIENVASHHNGGPGFSLRDACEGNLFLNCDSYSNYDPYSSTPGDDADGFDIGFITERAGNDRVNTLDGCRAWSNSDDGFDMYQFPGYHGIYVLRNCWAWKNGYRSDGTSEAGDGNGFKYGADNNYSYDGQVRRTTTNCVAYANRQRGFSQESANVKMLFYNNTAYLNGAWGFSFYYYDVGDVLRNNISYRNNFGTIENQGSNRVHDHDSWDSNVTLSDADFISLEASQLSLPRKSDGSLPDMTFLHLATGSDLIDAGVNVGLPYNGSAPDLGAFEFQTAIEYPVPVFLSASVENASPSTIIINYDQDLNNLVVPSSSAFKVVVNSVTRTISSVSVSGKKVTLKLSAAIAYGDAVLLTYTKPSANPLQTPAGKQAESLTSKSVKNNVSATPNTPPAVSITSPSSNSSFTAPASITITASATDANGKVTLVEFFNGTAKIGSKTASPYSMAWKNVAAGTYTLTAVATDDAGAKTTSARITVKVSAPTTTAPSNEPPEVSISSPVKGRSYENPANIEITVIASDPDGTVSKVELFSGDQKLVTLTSEPFTYVWKGVSAGTYEITAVATDNSNASATSAVVKFTVDEKSKFDAGSDVINLYPNPNQGHFTIDILVPLVNVKNEIVISDLTGNQVYRDIISPEETSRQIDLPKVRSGIYILSIVSNEIVVTKKVMIR
jgi:uncharacterized repeat protein (TIGR02059 family)